MATKSNICPELPLPDDVLAVIVDALATTLVNDMEADSSDEIQEDQEVEVKKTRQQRRARQ